MHDSEKSHSGVVATKPTNKAGRPAAESVEPRPGTKGSADQQNTHRTEGRARVTQALDRVRRAARQWKKEQFTALLHHMNVDLLRTAFYALKRKSSRSRCAPRRGEPVGSVQRETHRLREALGFPTSCLRAVSGTHEGQDGEWRRLREEECAIAGHSFTSWEAFEAHLAKWEREVANVRIHGTTGEAPIVRFERDEAHRLKLLGGRPAFGSLRELARVVGNDCAVEIDTNSYSVPWQLIGERVAVTVAAGEVRIRHGVREVAVHKQSQGRRLRVVDSTHLAGVTGRDGAVYRQQIATAPTVPSSQPSLLRPLVEYEAAIGGSF